MKRKVVKVGLITPYGGANLGDAAIQEAVIHNIRKRHPTADICLITLDPEKTCQIHGLSSFPLTSLTIGYYSQGHSNNKSNSNARAQQVGSEEPGPGVFARLKAALQKFPKLFSTLKVVNTGLRGVARFPGLMQGEISHFVAARRFMKGSNILLVSGGGQLDDYWGGPWGHPYSLIKWGLIARSIGARYAFLGVGTCALESWLSSFFIRRALILADYRSYRDQTSKSLLNAMDFTRYDAVCPDLVWSFDRKRLVLPDGRVENSEKIVGISPITYLRHNWPKKDSKVYENYIENLAIFVGGLARQGYLINFFTTNIADRNAVREIIEHLPRNSTLNVTGRVRQINTGTLNELFAMLAEVDYVVASRLHGVMLSHLVNKPVLAISYDRKVDTYMQDSGFSEQCIDIHKMNAGYLMETFKSMISEANNIESRLKEINSEYVYLSECQFNLILEI